MNTKPYHRAWILAALQADMPEPVLDVHEIEALPLSESIPLVSHTLRQLQRACKIAADHAVEAWRLGEAPMPNWWEDRLTLADTLRREDELFEKLHDRMAHEVRA